MPNELFKLAEALARQIESTAKDNEKVEHSIEKAAAEVAKKPLPSVELKGLLAAYMAVIRKAGSLTSARPASQKAIQAAEKDPTEATLKVAVAEIGKHIAELEKTSKADKAFAPLKKGLEDVIRKTEALI
jgi:hypothetical protein